MQVVLVIAEDRAICESLRAALPETDLLVFENTLADARRRLITLDADVILLDDSRGLGRTALIELRKLDPDVPVIVLSARSDAETRAGYILEGAKATVVKPFSCDELLDAIRRVGGSKREHPPASVTASPTTPRAGGSADPIRALRWLSRGGLGNEPAEITENLVEAVVETFDAVRCAIILENQNAVRVAASRGLSAALTNHVRMEFSAGLMRWLERNPTLFDPSFHQDAAAAKEAGVFGARLVAPLLASGRPFGAILVGDRASGVPYGPEDQELFMRIAQWGGDALEHAKHFQTIARQQKRLDAVLASIQAGVVTVKPDKTISMMNPSAERILRLRAADVLGQSVQKLGSAFADVILRTLSDNTPKLRHIINDAAVGGKVGLSATPLGVEGVVVIFSPLPREVESEHESLAYSPFWEHLASRVAQEIKNPMVAISTFAQLLPSKYKSADFRNEFFEVVQREISRVNNVVETLYRFAERPTLTLQKSILRNTAQAVLDSFVKEFEERNIALETEWASEEPEVVIDSIHLSQAIHNVIRNSVEAMPDGGTLKVATHHENGKCHLLVSDSGPGVTDDDAEQIFLPFYSTKETGMGLGLTVANRIMQQHEGDLRLREGTKEGSTFEFILPNGGKGGTSNGNHPGD